MLDAIRSTKASPGGVLRQGGGDHVGEGAGGDTSLPVELGLAAAGAVGLALRRGGEAELTAPFMGSLEEVAVIGQGSFGLVKLMRHRVAGR